MQSIRVKLHKQVFETLNDINISLGLSFQVFNLFIFGILSPLKSRLFSKQLALVVYFSDNTFKPAHRKKNAACRFKSVPM